MTQQCVIDQSRSGLHHAARAQGNKEIAQLGGALRGPECFFGKIFAEPDYAWPLDSAAPALGRIGGELRAFFFGFRAAFQTSPEPKSTVQFDYVS